jgi:hypothetical protein
MLYGSVHEATEVLKMAVFLDVAPCILVVWTDISEEFSASTISVCQIAWCY